MTHPSWDKARLIIRNYLDRYEWSDRCLAEEVRSLTELSLSNKTVSAFLQGEREEIEANTAAKLFRIIGPHLSLEDRWAFLNSMGLDEFAENVSDLEIDYLVVPAEVPEKEVRQIVLELKNEHGGYRQFAKAAGIHSYRSLNKYVSGKSQLNSTNAVKLFNLICKRTSLSLNKKKVILRGLGLLPAACLITLSKAFGYFRPFLQPESHAIIEIPSDQKPECNRLIADGNSKAEKGQWRDAIGSYEMAATTASTEKLRFEIYRRMINLHFNLGNYDAVHYELEQISKIAGHADEKAWYGWARGKLLLNRGMFSEAASILEDCLLYLRKERIHSLEHHVCHLLGRAYVNLIECLSARRGLSDSEIKKTLCQANLCFDAALSAAQRIKCRVEMHYVRRAQLSRVEKDYGKAQEYLDKASETIAKSSIYRSQVDLEQARLDMERGIRFKRSRDRIEVVLDKWRQVEYRKGIVEGLVALSDWELCGENSPNFRNAFNTLFVAHCLFPTHPEIKSRFSKVRRDFEQSDREYYPRYLQELREFIEEGQGIFSLCSEAVLGGQLDEIYCPLL